MSQAKSKLTKSSTTEGGDSVLSNEDILVFLREHPEFLQQHPQALEHQILDHECGGATSLVERQVKTLRQRIQDYANKLSELLHSARRNDVQFEKTKRLVVALSGCTTLAETASALNHSFISEFDAHAVRLVVFADTEEKHDQLIQLPTDSDQHALLSLLAEKAWAFCRTVEGSPLADLLANTDAPMQSCAILPIHLDKQPIAVVIVASAAADHYSEELDTLFLNHVAAVCSRVIGRICGK